MILRHAVKDHACLDVGKAVGREVMGCHSIQSLPISFALLGAFSTLVAHAKPV